MNKIDLKKLRKTLNKLAVQDLSETLETFETIVDPDSRLASDLLLLTAQNNTLVREKRMDIITPSFANTKANRLTAALTSYIKEVTEEDLVISAMASTKSLQKCILEEEQPKTSSNVPVVATHSNLTNPTAMKDNKPINIFISYSHKDEEYKNDLAEHLSVLRRNGTIAPWQDRDVQAGQFWDDEIKAALEKADYILLLISSSFLNSNYINDVEIKKALERHAKGDAKVIPVIIRPCDFSSSPLSRFQALPKDAKPIAKWDDRDEAFMNVVNGLKRLFR